METPYAKDNLTAQPLQHYLEEYKALDPKEAASRCNIPYDEDTCKFHVRIMGYKYLLSWPEAEVEKENPDDEGFFMMLEDTNTRVMAMRFLIHGQYVKSSGRYLTFREIPSGELYFRPFEGRCLTRLKFAFGFKLDKFKQVMEAVGGKAINMGDVGYEFEFINNLHVRFALWGPDEEFPPSSQILFEDNFPFAYQAEDLAHLGDISITTLKKLAQ